MNYTKITIGGKERGAKLGIGFLEQITRVEKLTIVELLTKFEQETIFILPKMLFHSLSYNDKVAGNEVDYSIHDVYDWVDELGLNSKILEDFCLTFANSIKVHLPQEEGKKKPQTKVAAK